MMAFQPRDQKGEWDDDGIIRKLGEYKRGHELVLANVIRDAVKKWRAEDYPGVTRRHPAARARVCRAIGD